MNKYTLEGTCRQTGTRKPFEAFRSTVVAENPLEAYRAVLTDMQLHDRERVIVLVMTCEGQKVAPAEYLTEPQ